MTPPSWPGREDVARRARRRWWRVMGLGGVVVAIGVAVGETVGLNGHHHRTVRHHSSTAVAIIVPIVIIAVAVVIGFFVLRRAMRDSEGRFAVPIVAGLPWRQRRLAGRNIRRGTPSDDPIIAGVERETAQRLISQARFSTVVFLIAIVGEAAEAVTQTSLLARVFFSAAVVLFAWSFGYNFWMVKRATRYLSQISDRS